MGQERESVESDVVLPSQAWPEDPLSSVRLPSYEFNGSDLLDFVPGTPQPDPAIPGGNADPIASIEHESNHAELYVFESDCECDDAVKNIQERIVAPQKSVEPNITSRQKRAPEALCNHALLRVFSVSARLEIRPTAH